MPLLAIETSQRTGGIAVRDRDGADHVEMLRQAKRHDDDLMPAVDRLFRRLGLKPDDLEAVGVSIGPGGFTGLRIAVSTAKMLAMAVGAKIIAVPTALVVAESMPAEHASLIGDGPIIVALASKRGSFWSTRLRCDSGIWSIAGTPGLADAASFERSDAVALFGDRYLPDPVRAACDSAGLSILEPNFAPAACLCVAARLLETGHITDPLALRPLYPREPEAVSLWERRRGDTASR